MPPAASSSATNSRYLGGHAIGLVEQLTLPHQSFFLAKTPIGIRHYTCRRSLNDVRRAICAV
jgi:hypothetical protein